MAQDPQPNETPDNPAALETYHQHAARAVPLGVPSDDQLAMIRTHLLDPAILDERDTPFVWSAQASNNQQDAYATRMHVSSLKNYAADAQAGVAFMNSHRTGGFAAAELPMGRSFDAKMTGGQGNGQARLDASFYTFRGLNLTGLSTDAFIDGLRSGVVRDVSIGFYGGEYRCSLCQRDMMRDYECRHFPGLSYDLVDKNGTPTGERETAVAWIHDAHLAEVSAVYDGATPGCMVSKAKRMADAGDLNPGAARLIEARYRIALPGVRTVYTSATPEGEDMADHDNEPATPTPEPEPTPDNGDPRPAQPADRMPEIRAVLAEHGLPGEVPDPLSAVRALAAETARLRPLADEGRAYRADLIEQALGEGVRAQGADFARETYTALLASAPLDTVKRMRDDWKSVADKVLVGGRQTRDEGDPAQANGSADERLAAPAAAYAG